MNEACLVDLESNVSANFQLHLENLRYVIAAHQALRTDSIGREANLTRAARFSGIRLIPGITINRPAEQIVQPFGLSVAALQEFTEDKTVIDHGSGKSDFLSQFPGSTTIAIDTNPLNRRFQQRRGHQTAADTAELADESVKLLNASWSLPFWARSEAHARSSANEFVRILSVGGVALINPIVSRTLLGGWEKTVNAQRYGVKEWEELTLPWQSGSTAAHSYALTAFLDEILKLTVDAADAKLHIATFRTKPKNDGYGRKSSEIPDCIMLRKAA